MPDIMAKKTFDVTSFQRRIYSWARCLRGKRDPNRQAAGRHRSFDSMSGILAWMLSLAGTPPPESGKGRGRALEIGTGQFMTHAAGLYACGYERVLTIDRYRQVSPELVRASMGNPVLSRRLLSPFVSHDDFLARMSRLEATRYDLARLAEIGVDYRAPMEAASILESSERFDLVFSYTVLEHVPLVQIPGLLSVSSSLLAPGGVAVHFIDMEDHREPRAGPFAFLAPSADWNEHACGERGNRVRASEWRGFFHSSTELIWSFPYAPVRRDAPLPATIDSRFSALDEVDLRTSALIAIAVAPTGH